MTSQHEVFPSILDNDLYKFTMQYAVLQHYKDTQAVYQFTNRDKDLQLNAEAVAWLDKQIKGNSFVVIIRVAWKRKRDNPDVILK